jgi:PAS domain S-box-containing protein
VGEVTHQLLHTIFPQPLDDITDTLRRTGRWEGELIHTRRDGTPVTVASRWALRQDDEGRPLAIMETNNDVTARKTAEHALRRQANLLEQTHDAILVWELPGTIVYWNRGAERLYGFSSAEAIGRGSHDLLRTEHSLPPERFEGLIERDGSWTGELTHRTRDGRRVVVDSRHVLVREADGRRLVVETNRDVTDRKRAEEALVDAQVQLAHVTRVTTLGEVTASLAHEVNQPLAAIVNNANACLGILPKGRELDEVREALADIVSDGDRAGAIIERVRGLSKRSPPAKVPLRLADVVDDVVALIAAESASRRVAIRTHVKPDLPVVVGDRVQLQQVLLNLVVNGMDAMGTVAEGERLLEIRGRAEGQDGSPAGARIIVADRGIGLERGREDSVFEAFYTTKPHGMGMGLAISRSIIEAHGGRLWAESNEGPGATFAFSLPAAVADAVRQGTG